MFIPQGMQKVLPTQLREAIDAYRTFQKAVNCFSWKQLVLLGNFQTILQEQIGVEKSGSNGVRARD